jgi:DNA-binding protein Alba
MRVTQNGKTRNYITGATELFENGADEVILSARGRAINKLVTVVEIIKQRCDFLEQRNELSCQELDESEDEDEELMGEEEQGDETRREIKSKKFQSILTVTLRRRSGEGQGAVSISGTSLLVSH